LCTASTTSALAREEPFELPWVLQGSPSGFREVPDQGVKILAVSPIAVAISALGPANFGASSTTTTSPVLRAEHVIVPMSSGASVHKSIASAEMLDPARTSAARKAFVSAPPYVTTVQSGPSRQIFAAPKGTRSSGPPTGPRTPFMRLCIEKITSPSEGRAVLISPFLYVVRGRRHHNDEARHVDEPRFEAVVVLWPGMRNPDVARITSGTGSRSLPEQAATLHSSQEWLG